MMTVTNGNRSANLTLSVNAPAGNVFTTTAKLLANESRSYSAPVTRAWDFGRATVSATFEMGNVSITKIVPFEIVCRSGCLVGIVTESISKAMEPVWYYMVMFLALAILYVGHAAHIYRLERGELSWWERLTLTLRATLRRNPMRALLLDKTGAQGDFRQEIEALHETALHLANMELLLKKGDRIRFLLEEEVILRKKRIAKNRKLRPYFKGWRQGAKPE